MPKRLAAKQTPVLTKAGRRSKDAKTGMIRAGSLPS